MTANKAGVVYVGETLNNNVTNVVMGIVHNRVDTLEQTLPVGIDMGMTIDDFEIEETIMFYKVTKSGDPPTEDLEYTADLTGHLNVEAWPYYLVTKDDNDNDVVPRRFYFEDRDLGLGTVLSPGIRNVFNRNYSWKDAQYRFSVNTTMTKALQPGVYKGFLYFKNNVDVCGHFIFTLEVKDIGEVIPYDPNVVWFVEKPT